MAMVERNYQYEEKFLVYRDSWFQLIRPLTFTATLSSVIAGTGLAAFKGASIRYELFIAILFVGLLVQSSVNMLNDYYDFQKGQDQEKWVHYNKSTNVFTPLYQMVPSVAFILFTIAILLGSWVGYESNTLWILIMGGLGVICGYKYSAGPRSLSSLGLAEVIAFIFLGFFPAFVGYVVQVHSLDLAIIALALPYALVSSTMLLTNNIRDIQKDENIRRTVAMRLGRNNAVLTLTILLTLAYLIVFILIVTGIVTPFSFITMVALPVAIRLRWLLRRNASRADEMKSMKCVAIHHWIFGLAFAISIWLAA